MEIFFSPWVVGTGSAVAAGLILYYIFGIGKTSSTKGDTSGLRQNAKRREYEIELESFRNDMVRRGLAHSYLRLNGEAALGEKYGIQKIKKIAVIGICASGKSVLGRELAERTGLPLFNMDNLFWKGKWEAVPEEMYLAKEREIIRQDEWIIEGYVDEKEADRLKVADLILYLDYSGVRVFWRTIRRWWKHRRVARPELHKEAFDTISIRDLWVAIMRLERPGIEAALKEVDQLKVTRFHSPKELRRFIDTKAWS